jgi:hypothetical protein
MIQNYNQIPDLVNCIFTVCFLIRYSSKGMKGASN